MEDYLMIIFTGNTDFSFMYPISMIITTTTNYNILQLQTRISYGLFFLFFVYGWLIDWCLTPTLAIFQLYHGIFVYSHKKREKRS